VVDVGMIDTSQIYFAVNHLHACGGVQTTASHNPAHYNGFKICREDQPIAGGSPANWENGFASGSLFCRLDSRAICSIKPYHYYS